MFPAFLDITWVPVALSTTGGPIAPTHYVVAVTDNGGPPVPEGNRVIDTVDATPALNNVPVTSGHTYRIRVSAVGPDGVEGEQSPGLSSVVPDPIIPVAPTGVVVSSIHYV